MRSDSALLQGARSLKAAICDRVWSPMMPLMRRLWPICRSIAGPGVRESLDVLGEELELQRCSTPSGQDVFDWTAPPEWRIHEAYVEDETGDRIIDFGVNNLHIIQYSEPVDIKLDLDELQKHLYSIPDIPDAIPYITSYYKRRWGFCLTERQRQALQPGRYRCVIKSEFRGDGQVDFAQFICGGASTETILFSTYLCHPSMANNELSGPVVQTRLMQVLAGLSGLRLQYRAAFTTETIGTLCFLSKFGSELNDHVRGGCVVSCVGDPGPYTFVRSRRRNSASDQIFEHVLTHIGAGTPIVLRDWHPLGSDERQYCSPGFNLPIGSFSRSRFEEFPEYHTSLDNLDFVTEQGLDDSLLLLLRACQAFELNCRPIRINPFGEPQLGKRGLYASDRTSVDRATLDRMFILAYADGETDMLKIANEAGRPIWELLEPLQSLVDADLVRLTAD